MDRSHLSSVAELERMCFTTPWNEAMLEEELYNPTASFLVAEGEDGQVLGYAGLHVVLDEGYIDNVAVRPAYRRTGVADRLLDVFCRFGEANLAFLTLEVRPSNTAAVALYEKHGFHEVGRRKDYYENPTEDALLLTKEFQHDPA
jgi:ribosomal-protein-alanine N-acetyltransferase